MNLIRHIADLDGGIADGLTGEGNGGLRFRSRRYLINLPLATIIRCTISCIARSHRTRCTAVLIQIVISPVWLIIDIPITIRIICHLDIAFARSKRCGSVSDFSDIIFSNTLDGICVTTGG